MWQNMYNTLLRAKSKATKQYYGMRPFLSKNENKYTVICTKNTGRTNTFTGLAFEQGAFLLGLSSAFCIFCTVLKSGLVNSGWIPQGAAPGTVRAYKRPLLKNQSRGESFSWNHCQSRRSMRLGGTAGKS